MRILGLLAVVAVGCEIDSSKLDRISCSPGDDCGAPDLDCVGGFCVAPPCDDYLDCGPGFQFVCEEGLCRAVGCATESSCAAGFECVDGFCAGEACEGDDDRDQDGFFAVECGGRDCDDDDAAVRPDATEGAGGQLDDTCSDGVDNDCDGAVDGDEPPCGPCDVDGDCDDGNPCTSERCAEGDCLASPLDGEPCDDGDPCTRDDSCSLVTCAGLPYECDDEAACTADECDGAGGCTNEIEDGSCLVDGACFEDGTANPGNGCERCDADTAPRGWTPLSDQPCDDDDLCTSGDACQEGECVGMSYECDDGLTCTLDSCDGSGGCDAAIAAGSCLVAGVCYADGDPSPLDVCDSCDPDADAGAFSPDDTAVPDDGLACTVDRCLAGEALHEARDALCENELVCAPCAGTVTGCVAAPGSLALACPTTSAQGDPGASCSVDLGGLAGQSACVSCASQIGITPLVREDFSGCPDLAARGWTVAGTPTCPIDLGVGPDPLAQGDALEADDESWTLTRTFDTTGLDEVRLCFDYADDNAGNNDRLEIEIDTDGTFDSVFDDSSGPVANVDDTFVRFCIDLVAEDPAAADNPSLNMRIRATATGADDNVYLDTVVLEGWLGASVTFAPFFEDDFAACDLASWIAAGDSVGCPVAGGPFDGQDALFASASGWTLATTLDASAICEDLTISFDYATDGAGAADSGSLSFGEPLELAWAAFGPPAAEGAFQRISVDLAHRDPGVRFDPAVDISFGLTATGGTVLLDDVEASGATCAAGGLDVSITGPTDAGSGLYDVGVVSAIRARTYVDCSWDGRAALMDRAAIDFLP